MVISSQRTGSTALTTMLSKFYKANCFIEPAEQQHKLEEFESIHRDFTRRYIVKFMVDRIGNYRIYQNLINEEQPFKIGLYRKNTVAQVTSLYCASHTGIWYGNQVTDIIEPDETLMHLPIKVKKIDRFIKFISKNNTLLRAYKTHYDRILCHETIPFGNTWRQSLKPTNYTEIVAAVNERFVALDKPTTFNLEA